MSVRNMIGAVIVAGAMALGSAVTFAQNVPSQFVVSGKAAEQIQDFTTINLATAERIAETCEKLATEQNVAITMYVLDNDGNHVYMDRMDGQGYLNIITAEMKARTALMQRGPSKAVMNQVRQNPNAELQRIQLGMFPNSGGLPVVVNTSLNTAGRPIVDTPREALELFGSAPIDLLAIGPFAVHRAAVGR